MKKQLLLVLGLFVACVTFAQTDARSFEYSVRTPQHLSRAEITAFIAKSNFENYRLLNNRTTLTFDNGFDIVLLSANEMQAAGLISNTNAYSENFPKTFRLPVFHLADNGFITAGYNAYDKKYRAQ
jgi:hypothetical protein